MESNRDSPSSGERTGKSLNRHGVIARWRCRVGVVGPTGSFTGGITELQSLHLAEGHGKGRQRR
jgi:hypothetical protein